MKMDQCSYTWKELDTRKSESIEKRCQEEPASSKRLYLVTKCKYGDCQRQLTWFSKHTNGLYFEVFGFFQGSHISYHRDGSIWRTSPVLGKEKIGYFLPFDAFRGWCQIGTSMTQKSLLEKNPCLSRTKRSKALAVNEVEMEVFPSETINLVTEFIEPDWLKSIPSSLKPPPGAELLIFRSIVPNVVLTVLGHHNNLLIRPAEDGFHVCHYSNRYSANLKDMKYKYEVYGT